MKYLRLVVLIAASSVLAACNGIKTTESVFSNTSSSCAEGASENRFIVQWEDGSYTVEHAESKDDFKKSFLIKNLALVKHVDPDYTIKLTNQEDLSQFDDGSAHAAGMNWGPASISAPQLWSQGVNGSGVIVGVVDGMVDTSHGQLASNIVVNTGEIPGNGIDDDHNGFIDDYKGIQVNAGTNKPSLNRHGTHVAGIIVADESLGPVSGVAQKAKVLPAQFIDNDGGGSIGDAIIALNYVAAGGAKIINMSWGLDACVAVPNLQSTLKQLNDKGILLVTASGNGDSRGVGINMDIYPSYPSAYNFLNQINVAASTSSNFLIGFSNFGQKSVHVAAPGVGIYSTVPGNQVEVMSGTSMAAPMVSGAAALLWGAIPSATAAQIKQAIVKSVDFNSSSPLQVSSGGTINVYNALAQLKTITGK